jgi:hypothetical protein
MLNPPHEELNCVHESMAKIGNSFLTNGFLEKIPTFSEIMSHRYSMKYQRKKTIKRFLNMDDPNWNWGRGHSAWTSPADAEGTAGE